MPCPFDMTVSENGCTRLNFSKLLALFYWKTYAFGGSLRLGSLHVPILSLRLPVSNGKSQTVSTTSLQRIYPIPMPLAL